MPEEGQSDREDKKKSGKEEKKKANVKVKDMDHHKQRGLFSLQNKGSVPRY